jgi:hypothetical protein
MNNKVRLSGFVPDLASCKISLRRTQIRCRDRPVRAGAPARAGGGRARLGSRPAEAARRAPRAGAPEAGACVGCARAAPAPLRRRAGGIRPAASERGVSCAWRAWLCIAAVVQRNKSAHENGSKASGCARVPHGTARLEVSSTDPVLAEERRSHLSSLAPDTGDLSLCGRTAARGAASPGHAVECRRERTPGERLAHRCPSPGPPDG